jgi:hypothetical protein
MNRGEQDRTFLVIAGDATKRRAVFTVWRDAEAIRAELVELSRNWADLVPAELRT